MPVAVPVLGIAGLLKQFANIGIEYLAELDRVLCRICAVCVYADRAAISECVLDDANSLLVGADVFPNLDLKRSES